MNDYKSKPENESKKNGRGKRFNKNHDFKKTRSKGNAEKESKEFSKVKESANDPSWYYYSEQSLKDAGRFSFNNALGVALPVGSSYLSVPGIMNIYTVPTIGISINNTSAANLAAKNIYSYVRHANSGHTNYDSPDLFMYFMAMDSLYSMYAWMTRIYGLAKIYIQQNRFYGANMLRSMGVDATDIARNLANFRTFINQFAVKLSAFYVPASLSVYKRHTWMYANVFADEDDPKAQVYMYQPAYLLQYDEVNGELVPVEITCSISSTSGIGIKLPGTLGLSQIQVIANTMIEAVIASESLNIMSGDVLKAYGAENCWKFDAIPDEYAILPLFSEEVLVQIHNTKFVGPKPVMAAGDSTYTTDALKVYQNRTPGYGAILYTPVFADMGLIDLPQVFDTWHRDVSPEEVMVGSRNMIAGQTVIMQDGSSNYRPYAIVGTAGSELCLFAVTWSIDNAGNYLQRMHYETSKYYPSWSDAVLSVTRESRFNEAPLGTRWDDVNTSTGVRAVQPHYMTGELSNYVLMDIIDIQKLHDTALLSEFAVPFLGNAVKR